MNCRLSKVPPRRSNGPIGSCWNEPTLSSPAALALIAAREPYHDNIHLFPSGVDITLPADSEEFEPPDDIVALGSPVLGYFGVIDDGWICRC